MIKICSLLYFHHTIISSRSSSLYKIYLSNICFPSLMYSSYSPCSIASSASSKPHSNFPFSSLIRKISCMILQRRTLSTYRLWLTLCSVRMSSAHSYSTIQWLKLSYSYRLIFSPTFSFPKRPYILANFSLISLVSFLSYLSSCPPSSVFMNSMTSFELISAL